MTGPPAVDPNLLSARRWAETVDETAFALGPFRQRWSPGGRGAFPRRVRPAPASGDPLSDRPAPARFREELFDLVRATGEGSGERPIGRGTP